jgi:hypothetical protein
MAEVKTIATADGRVIEVTEGELRKAPPPAPVKKKQSPRTIHGKKKVRASRGRATYSIRGNKHPMKRKIREIPGFAEWLGERKKTVRLLMSTPIRPVGCTNGMSVAKAEALWEQSRIKAKADMEKIKKKVDLSEAAEEALEEVITVMRGPQNQQMKLQAARMVLEWTMAKPVAKSEVTVNTAEKWLESIAEDEEGGGGQEETP